MRPIRWRCVASVLAVVVPLGGCANHITGYPPPPPWYRLTKEGRGIPRGLTPASAETAAYKAWVESRAATDRWFAECLSVAPRERDRATRERLEAACVKERDVRVKRAAEDFERNSSGP